MKKKDRETTISKKSMLSVLIVVISYAGVFSYLVAMMILDMVPQNNSGSIFNLMMTIFPILIIVFGIFASILFVIFNNKSWKR